MKYFINYDGCGSDSVLYLDGRWSLERMKEEARNKNRSPFRGYSSFEIIRGESLTRGVVIYKEDLKC